MVFLIIDFSVVIFFCALQCGETPFLWAAKQNKYNLIDIFANNDRNEINTKNKDGNTALHLAVKESHHDAVMKLHLLSKIHGLKEDIRNKVNCFQVLSKYVRYKEF